MKKFLIILIFLLVAPITSEALQLGLHMDISWYDESSSRQYFINKDKALRPYISRNSFLWHKIEPAQGQKNWSNFDGTINELAAGGMEPLFVVYGSPAWANGSSDYLYVPTGSTQFEAWLSRYKAFMTEAATRYKGKVKKWELWNEENEQWFWKPGPNVDQYARWYTEIYKVIKSIDPTAQVSMGGMAGLVASGGIPGYRFLEQLYQRGVYPDIVNIHPYDVDAPDHHTAWQMNFDDIAAIRQTMVNNGQSGKPIWVTEWGWGTGSGGIANVDYQTQANYLRTSMEMLLNQYTYVTVATWFTDYDRSGWDYGLFTSSFVEKPSAAVFRDYANRLYPTTPSEPPAPPPPPPPPPPSGTKPSPPSNLRIVR